MVTEDNREKLDAALKDLIAAYEAAAYERGYRDGSEAVTNKVYLAVGAALPPAVQDAPRHVYKNGYCITYADQAERARRAPRGLTGEVVSRALSDAIALPMEEVQRRAVEMDSRISPKTVYNELYRNRETTYFQDTAGRWRLRRPSDDIQPSLIDAPQEREQQEALTAH